MKGWLRLGIVASAFWVVGVCTVAIAEFILRDPNTCKSAEAFLDAAEIFFTCNRFADVVPSTIDRVFRELRTTYFVLVAFGPVIVGWILAVTFFFSGRWVIRGFKE